MEFFSRTEALLGEKAVDKLKTSTVVVFGIGGVGSYAVEALARCGVGRLVLIDGSRVHPTNINRQIHALLDTVGKPKVDVMKERILKINPSAVVKTHHVFVLPQTVKRFIDEETSYIIDAVDTVSVKAAIAEAAFYTNTPLISCMGTGNKIDPTRFRVADIYETKNDPLSRVMRKELRKRNIPSLNVVFSDETPVVSHDPPASISFVPSVAGLIMAGVAVRYLIRQFL